MVTRTDSGRAHSSKHDYYYVQGQKIQVTQQAHLIAVIYHARVPADEIATVGRSRGLVPAEDFPQLQESNVRLYHVEPDRENARADLARELSAEENVQTVGEVFVTEFETPVILTDQLVCKFNPDLTPEQINQICETYGLEVIEELGLGEITCVLRVPPGSARSALEIANELQETEKARYAYPNWVEHIGMRAQVLVETERHGLHPTDPLFARQWHHDNTGQSGGTAGADIRATMAWQMGGLGSPAIRVAVVDGGVDIFHNDLNAPGKVLDPIDLMVTPPDNDPLGGAHGTQVAGMAVAAANNPVVGCGSAPGCRLIPIKAGDTMAQVLMAKAFLYAADHGADVITCSLGPNGAPWLMTDFLREAIDYATTYGRNGRGCVYFQAVDNRSTTSTGAANPISGDQVSAYERSIAVTRTTHQDRHDGAAMGVELDLAAPGTNVMTITNCTRNGAGAITNANTNTVTTGTSFAAPLTAGVGALVLSRNPNLSWEEVRQVLLDSADKIDAAANPYLPAPAHRPPGTRNDRYGYGRVNAQRAVELAQRANVRDLYLRDTLADTGSVPQPAWGFWDSPDLWVRNADDGGAVHQDTVRGRDNFVFARVWNRGTQPSLPAWVRFFITTFAGTEFRYPYDFKPDTTATIPGGTPGRLRPRSAFPAAGSYLIGTVRIPSVPAGGNVIVRTPWNRALIPPAAGWHPCLLVEVSPHDGPTATGQHVWENNNLGQKNITIVNARAGDLIDFPFQIGHPTLVGPFVGLEIQSKELMGAQWFLDAKDPKLLQAMVGLLPAEQPAGPVTAPVTGNVVKPGLPALPVRPWRVTFLEEAKLAIANGEERAEEAAVMMSFPKGSMLEIGRAAAVEAEAGLPAADDDDDDRAPGMNAKVVGMGGVNVLALMPAAGKIALKVPAEKLMQKEVALKLRIPANMRPGTYTVDVGQRNAQGMLVGGVRLQVNVTA